jgi:hypothetical protein
MKGKTEARIFTPEARKLTEDTSLGFAMIEYGKTFLNKTLYPWQEWFLIHAFEIVGDLEKEWRFRFRAISLEVARQNGKTTVSEVIASFFCNVLDAPNIFGTSLSLEKAEEVWEAVIKDQEENKSLARMIDYVARRNGGKKLVLKNGSNYKVGAPTRRAGRGDSNDLVLLDELRELRDYEVWSAAVASTVAKPNGIVVCFSNAGDPDSIVLRELRAKAVEMIDGTKVSDFGSNIDVDSLGWFEWSAPDGAATDDMEALAQANPALGYGFLTERALLSNRATFPENKFRSECMCQQVETILPQPFPDGAWEACLDDDSQIAPESEIYFGIDLSQDRRWCTIAACGMREDGNYHIEVIKRQIGTEWAYKWFESWAAKGKTNLAFQGRGCPVCGLAEQICTIKNVERIAIEGGELPAGWGRFFDAIAASAPLKAGETPIGGVKIYHLSQPVLDAPGKTMQLRNLGGGVSLPDRVKSPDDPAPLIACIMAFSAATRVQQVGGKKIYESSYASGSELVFA